MRGAPFKKERLIKCGKAFIKARYECLSEDERGTEPLLMDGDLFAALDNQKPGLVSKLYEFMKDSKGKRTYVSTKRFTMVYDFESMRARKQKVRGVGTINQTETLIAVSTDGLIVPVHPHKTYLGMNTGSIITDAKIGRASVMISNHH